MMTAAGAHSQSSTKFLRNIGHKEKKSEELKFDFLGLLGFVLPLFHCVMRKTT